MIKQVLQYLKSNDIIVDKYKKNNIKTGQKEVFFIEVNNIEYVLKIINVTPYYIYDDYAEDDPEFKKAVKEGISLLSSRANLEIRMAKECKNLPQMKFFDKPQLLQMMEEYYLFYIEEKVEGMPFRYSKKYNINEINDFLVQMIDHIIIMDKAHYVHRDIKPNNIIYNKTNNIYSLIDGGICKNTDFEYRLTGTDKPLGTPRYMSPEQIKISPNEKWNFQTDLFPLGIISIEMFIPLLREEPNEELRDLQYVLKKWQEASQNEKEILYFKKIIVNLCQTTRALRFNNLEKLKNILIEWKEELK